MPEVFMACTPLGDRSVALAFVDRVSQVDGPKRHYSNLGNFRDADGSPCRIDNNAAFGNGRQRLVAQLVLDD